MPLDTFAQFLYVVVVRDILTISRPDQLKALGHPLRLQVLETLGTDDDEEELTNRELAQRLGVDPGHLHFHVRMLLGAGLIELVERERGREKPYRAVARHVRVAPELIATGAANDAREAEWALAEGAARAESTIGRYAAAVALLVLRQDGEARVLADGLRTADGFPHDVGDALATIAAGDRVGYVEAIESVLKSFETREEYLEDVPIADTVMVLQTLAAVRDLAADLASPLLPF